MTSGLAVIVAIALQGTPFAMLDMAQKVIFNPAYCPDSPDDVQVCTMAGGCPGLSYCYGLNQWTACQCDAAGGELGSACQTTSTSGGMAGTQSGKNVCNASCGYTCSGNLTWQKSQGKFDKLNATTGLKAFAVFDCGASSAGRCPVTDTGTDSGYTEAALSVPSRSSRDTNDTPAPLHGNGCALGTSTDPCRFAAESNSDVLNVRLVRADDASGGQRNELSRFRTTSGNSGIIYGADFGGQAADRYYSITVQVPSTTVFANPSTWVAPAGLGLESQGATFWQVLPLGNCGPDQMSMLAIRRTDTGSSGEDQRGNGWQFTYWVKSDYASASTRIWPATQTGTTALTPGLDYTFVVRRYFPSDPKGPSGSTTLWVNGSPIITTSMVQTMYPWPHECEYTSAGCTGWNPPGPAPGPFYAACPNRTGGKVESSAYSAGNPMPEYVKVGFYGTPHALSNDPYGLKISNVQHGETCADVWTSGGTPCP